LLRSLARMLGVINNGGDLGDRPTLRVHGEADTLVPIGPSRLGIERIRGTRLSEIIYPEARPEVFNEIDSDHVLDDVIDFVRPIVDR
jgi:alpha-beta hydrolase superfamily lysophospholipase